MASNKPRKFKVIGQTRVAGVEPGGEVTEERLHELGTNIDALLGVHLEKVSGPPMDTAPNKDDDTK